MASLEKLLMLLKNTFVFSFVDVIVYIKIYGVKP
jgi:hypothetical protein